MAADELTSQYNAAFKVKTGYMETLAAAAYSKTNDPSFIRPEGDNVTWHPWPIFSLKALGLTFADDNRIAYVAAHSIFYAKGDEQWLQKLKQIHSKNGIYFERTRIKQ